MSPLRKKDFSTASMKVVFLWTSKYSDSFVLAKTGLREEGSQCQSKTFPKMVFAFEVLSMYLPYIRKIFSNATVKFFSL